MTTQLDLLPAVPRTRLTKVASTSKVLPRSRLDKSMTVDARHLKVSVVTQQYSHTTSAGKEEWRTIKRHAVFTGATAHTAADAFLAMLESGGFTPMPANQCVADGITLSRGANVFTACAFPSPVSGDSAGGGRKSAVLTRREPIGAPCPHAAGRERLSRNRRHPLAVS